jgi:hypothetical protein
MMKEGEISPKFAQAHFVSYHPILQFNNPNVLIEFGVG